MPFFALPAWVARRRATTFRGKVIVMSSDYPPGFTLLCTLAGHTAAINRVQWSLDGRLASCSEDQTVRIWEPLNGRLLQTLTGHSGWVWNGAWIGSDRFASGSEDHTIRVWNVATGQTVRVLTDHDGPVYSLSYLTAGGLLASGSYDRTVRIWNPHNWTEITTLCGHHNGVNTVSWRGDGRLLATGSNDWSVRLWERTPRGGAIHSWGELQGHQGSVNSVLWQPPHHEILVSVSDDCTIRVWDFQRGWQARILQGHTDKISRASFLHEGRLMATKSYDGTIRFWRCDTWTQVEVLPEAGPVNWHAGLAFHPEQPILATLGDNGSVIRIWRLDIDALLRRAPRIRTVDHSYAKVVLVGDTGVGKTTLSQALAGRPGTPTVSSHGLHVTLLDSREKTEVVQGVPRVATTEEVLLWDLAGQPGYRVFHQLHLNDVAVGLVLFDSRSETNPFAGVPFWSRALDVARRQRPPGRSGGPLPLVKILVASRADVGGLSVSNERLQEALNALGFNRFFETSGLLGTGVDELRAFILQVIDWESMPRITSPEVFHRLKQYLVEQVQAAEPTHLGGGDAGAKSPASARPSGALIRPRHELLDEFRRWSGQIDVGEDVFDTCLRGLESAGLVMRLDFRDMVILRPEMLDSYCAWMANASRQQPDGLGWIRQDDATAGIFLPAGHLLRLPDPVQEAWLLQAAVHYVVERGIAYQLPTQEGTMLVFPSEVRQDFPDYPRSYVPHVVFEFQGPVSAIYATLAVALKHSTYFNEEKLYKNAMVCCALGDQVCGFVVEYPQDMNDAVGRLTVFFAADTSVEVKLLFLQFVHRHLARLAYPGTLRRERVYQCPGCRYSIPPEVVRKRFELGKTTVVCPVCERVLPTDDLIEGIQRPDKAVLDLEVDASEAQRIAARIVSLPTREANDDFHVFLAHRHTDREAVALLARKLRAMGILAWFDRDRLLPGQAFIPALESILERVPAAAVIVGPGSLGRWEREECYSLLLRRVEGGEEGRRRRPVLIPVLLPGADLEKAPLPLFLRGLTQVDFRGERGVEDRNELRRLVRAILGERYEGEGSWPPPG